MVEDSSCCGSIAVSTLEVITTVVSKGGGSSECSGFEDKSHGGIDVIANKDHDEVVKRGGIVDVTRKVGRMVPNVDTVGIRRKLKGNDGWGVDGNPSEGCSGRRSVCYGGMSHRSGDGRIVGVGTSPCPCRRGEGRKQGGHGQ